MINHLVHLSQSLDWGKKKFYHIEHKYIKKRNLTASEQKRYLLVAELVIELLLETKEMLGKLMDPMVGNKDLSE